MTAVKRAPAEISLTSLTHGLLLSVAETAALRSGELDGVVRPMPTRLRMPVALIASTGQAEGLSSIASVRPAENGRHRWMFGKVSPLQATAVEIGSNGPFWARLPLTARNDVIDGAQRRQKELEAEQRALAEAARKHAEEELAAQRAAKEKSEKASADKPSSPVAGRKGELVVPSEYMGTSALTVDQAVKLLQRFRDEVLKPAFPDTPPALGFLRKNMLEALVEECVTSREDYVQFVPSDLRRRTDIRQVDACIDTVLAILKRTV